MVEEMRESSPLSLVLVFLSFAFVVAACDPSTASPLDGGDGDAKLEDASDEDERPAPCVPLRCEDIAKDGKAACGLMRDGCGGQLDCGSDENLGCDEGFVCVTDPDDGINRCEVRATECETVDPLVACEGVACGYVSIGCGKSVLCRQCEEGSTCVSGTCVSEGSCEPLDPEALCLGRCGMMSDGCDEIVDCAEFGGAICAPGQECGELNGEPNHCVGEICEPQDCESLGATCGYVVDPCTGLGLDCWPNEDKRCEHPGMSCHGTPLQCSSVPEDCEGPLCAHIPRDCAPDQPTRIRGRLTTPSGELGIPNAIVYIPSSPSLGALPPVDEGIHELSRCDRCTDEFERLGSVLTATVTDAHGNFTLEGAIPVGNGFRIVAKAGRFRAVRSMTVNAAYACEELNIGNSLRLPERHEPASGRHLPKIAIVSGDADAMECVLLKMGFDRGEFNSRGSDARFHLYRGNGGGVHGIYRCIPKTHSPGSHCFASPQQTSAEACETFPLEECMWQGELPPDGPGDRGDLSVPAGALFDSDPSNGKLTDYDLVIANCPGAPGANIGLQPDSVVSYLNQGGRIFASHWSYDYLGGTGAYADMTGAGSSYRDRVYGAFGRPRRNDVRLLTYARWLDSHGAALVQYDGGVPIFAMMPDVFDPRDLTRSVSQGVEEWLFRTKGDEEWDQMDPDFLSMDPASTSVQQFSFNTPLDKPADEICGRASFTAFHVMGHGGAISTKDQFFPSYCPPGVTLSPQEKSLAYLLFDLAACVSNGGPPAPPACVPLGIETCGQDECGLRSDGCGGLIDCGGCEGGAHCSSAGICVEGCTERTCASAGYECGLHSDGCAGVIDCGTCDGNARCGLAAPGKCAECMPLTCASAEVECGELDNGCGGILDCGSCGPGRYCGIGNRCEEGASCVPKTCESAGAQCGLLYDGCGGVIQCGTCPAPQVCGYPVANQCGSVG